MTPSDRITLLQHFIKDQHQAFGLDPDSLVVASADASFRRYWRIGASQSSKQSTTLIIMDAPPEHEDCQPFIQISQRFRALGLNTPRVLAQDLNQGFLLLDDLGQTTYLQALQTGADHRPLYEDALKALIQLQLGTPHDALPPYGQDKLMQEMGLFETWFLNQHHNIFLSEREKKLLGIALELISKACSSQQTVWVHRDYHCRNLMQTTLQNPGILDFQDAVAGPYTYDLASLLRDAYIDWPEEAQIDLALNYWQKAKAAGLGVPEDFGVLWRDFEWMGLQRHLKVLGIFARLYHRDGKDGYLKDLPLVLRYAHRVAQRYDGLGILVRLLDRVQGIERANGMTF